METGSLKDPQAKGNRKSTPMSTLTPPMLVPVAVEDRDAPNATPVRLASPMLLGNDVLCY
jgi:hypothetical protein